MKHKLILLYDYYGSLLTESQQQIFEDYYHNDCSLAEISEMNNVSRNAIHKQLKTIEDKLTFYEEKLSLLKKRDLILERIDDKTKKDLEELI